MLVGENHEFRNVTNIDQNDLKLINAFIQGAIYSWSKNVGKDHWFAVRDLFGGENFYWEETPLMALFEKQKKMGKKGEESIKASAKDLGWITKNVINEDKRTFETRKAGLVRQYRWTGAENNWD